MASLDERIHAICLDARKAARQIAPRSTADKNRALAAVAAELAAAKEKILRANAEDLAAGRDKGLSSTLLDRLMLDDARIAAMVKSVEEVRELPDPVGSTIAASTRPNGLRVSRVRVPLGVVAMIYEARPNVTVEASTLTLKTGNAIVLRGGSEAARSNAALAEVLGDALDKASFPRASVNVVPFTERDAVRALVQQSGLVDLAIPRGGEALIRFVTENARVPVVQHYKGVCHMFLDAGADAALAEKLVLNAKLSRPAACNALECLLVDAADAARLLPPLADALLARGCELRGDPRARELAPGMKEAAAADWGTEFGEPILAVRVVDGLEGALEHVAAYGSGHTEAIVTTHAEHAARWRNEVDAACVVVNASTRFHDGGELGLGAEIGIATSRLHWRGPMGLESLTTMKWVIDGEGQIR